MQLLPATYVLSDLRVIRDRVIIDRTHTIRPLYGACSVFDTSTYLTAHTPPFTPLASPIIIAHVSVL